MRAISKTLLVSSLLLSQLGAVAQVVKVDGSSTVYPITEGVAEDFQKMKKNAIIKAITVAELKQIWEPSAQGKVMRWNQVNPACPDAPIQLFGAGSDSGSFDYFTEAINGEAKASRGDYTASEDDNVLVQGVAQAVNAISYFGYACCAENQSRLRAVPIVGKPGKPAVLPSEAAVIDGTYQPLSRPIFICVNANSLAKPGVREFANCYMKNAAKFAKEVKCVPLPAMAYAVGLDHLAKGKKGTVMGGKNEVGIRIEELLAREAKLCASTSWIAGAGVKPARARAEDRSVAGEETS